ncbi:MAG: hypothetical protein BRC31_05970, partial [Actinobacteria bacterium QS_5_72_10]
MARIGSLSETALPWLVAVAAVIGLALPGPGRVTAGHGGVQAVLVVLVFATGLGISPGAALRRTRVGGAGELLSSPLSLATVVVLVWLVASQAELSAALVPAALAVVTFLAGSIVLGEVVAYRAGTETSHALRLSLGMRDFAVAAGAAT